MDAQNIIQPGLKQVLNVKSTGVHGIFRLRGNLMDSRHSGMLEDSEAFAGVAL